MIKMPLFLSQYHANWDPAMRCLLLHVTDIEVTSIDHFCSIPPPSVQSHLQTLTSGQQHSPWAPAPNKHPISRSEGEMRNCTESDKLPNQKTRCSVCQAKWLANVEKDVQMSGGFTSPNNEPSFGGQASPKNRWGHNRWHWVRRIHLPSPSNYIL